MSRALYDLDGLIADILKPQDITDVTQPRNPNDQPETIDLYGASFAEERTQTELYELLALMHVPTREIIDPDERSEYESYLAARVKGSG